MKISEKSHVTIAFTLRNRKGDVLDSSESFSYVQGSGTLVRGLEEALMGKEAGEELEIRLNPDQAYGEHMPQLIRTMPRSAFQGTEELEVGMEFKAARPGGQTMVVRIDEIDDDQVTVNANHPLAGATLDYELKILDVKEA